MTECTRAKGVPELAGCHCYYANHFGYMGFVWVYSRLVRVRWGNIGRVPMFLATCPWTWVGGELYYPECGQESWILT